MNWQAKLKQDKYISQVTTHKERQHNVIAHTAWGSAPAQGLHSQKKEEYYQIGTRQQERDDSVKLLGSTLSGLT
jgi:hypothetical protein